MSMSKLCWSFISEPTLVHFYKSHMLGSSQHLIEINAKCAFYNKKHKGMDIDTEGGSRMWVKPGLRERGDAKRPLPCVCLGVSAMRILVLYTFVAFLGPTLGDTFVSEIGRALEKISSSPDSYSLIPGIRFEARKEVRVRARRLATLVDSAEEVFTNHDLVWDIAPGLEIRIYSGDDGGFHISAGPSNKVEDTSRTFGVMRRMKLVLLPIMYKLGVITTLLTMLTVFALKGLTIGVFLLVMTSAGFLAKLKGVHHDGYSHQKDIHVHVNGGYSHHYPLDRDSPYQGPYYQNQQIPSNNQRSPWDAYIN